MGTRKGRKPGNKSTDWIRDTVLRIYTEDQVREDWDAITAVDRLKIASSWVPKEVKMDSNTEIRLVINGLEQRKSIDARVIESLPAHEDDDS